MGQLAADRGTEREAEGWYRRAAEAGHPDAAHNLAVLLAKQGKADEAAWYRRTAGRAVIDATSATAQQDRALPGHVQR
jgi:TPR repeat protein